MLLFLNRPPLLIRILPIVTRRTVAAHQKLEFTVITDGARATDIGSGAPDHLRVMTAHFAGGTRLSIAIPMVLFFGPALHAVSRGIPARAAGPKVLALARSFRMD